MKTILMSEVTIVNRGHVWYEMMLSVRLHSPNVMTNKVRYTLTLRYTQYDPPPKKAYQFLKCYNFSTN